MCGIAAMFAYGSAAPAVDRQEIEAVTERMRPRGPDAGGVWLSADSRVALGARRLAGLVLIFQDSEETPFDRNDALRRRDLTAQRSLLNCGGDDVAGQGKVSSLQLEQLLLRHGIEAFQPAGEIDARDAVEQIGVDGRESS